MRPYALACTCTILPTDGPSGFGLRGNGVWGFWGSGFKVGGFGVWEFGGLGVWGFGG